MSCCVDTTPRLRRFTCPVFAPSSLCSSSPSLFRPSRVPMPPAPAMAVTPATATPASRRLTVRFNRRAAPGTLRPRAAHHAAQGRLYPEFDLVERGLAGDLECLPHEFSGTAEPTESGLSDPLFQIEFGQDVRWHLREAVL